RAATVVAESKDTRRRAGSFIAKAPKEGGKRFPKERRPPPPKTQGRPAPQNPATTPKGRRSPGRAGSGPGGLPGVVVGRLDGHLDVVRVTLTQAGRGDTHQLTTLPQLCHGPGAGVPHGLVKPSDKLVGHCRERSTERYLTLDALGNELVLGSDLGLGVTVLGEGAATHRTERTHTTVGLELLAVDEDQFAG